MGGRGGGGGGDASVSWNIKFFPKYNIFFWVSLSIRNFLGWICLFSNIRLKNAGFNFRKYKKIFFFSKHLRKAFL